MTKENLLDILQLLSALESWSFANNQRLPDYLLEHLQRSVDVLREEVMK